MAEIVAKNSIVLPKTLLHRQGGVVILDLKEYKRFLKYEIEREYIDTIVKEGLKEERQGKTEPMESFLKREYPKLHEDYTH